MIVSFYYVETLREPTSVVLRRAALLSGPVILSMPKTLFAAFGLISASSTNIRNSAFSLDTSA